MTTIESSRPVRRPRERLFERRHLAAIVDRDAARRCAGARDRLADLGDDLAERPGHERWR